MNIPQVTTLLEEFLRTSGFAFDSITVEEKPEKDFLINIHTSDSVKMIGNRGEVLMALHHLVKNILRSQGLLAEDEHVKVDIDSYRLKQEQHVLDMARRSAQSVTERGKSVVLPPMSGYFRRLVHMFIAHDFPSLQTESEGDGSFRAVRIFVPGNDSSAVQDVEEEVPGLYDDFEG